MSSGISPFLKGSSHTIEAAVSGSSLPKAVSSTIASLPVTSNRGGSWTTVAIVAGVALSAAAIGTWMYMRQTTALPAARPIAAIQNDQRLHETRFTQAVKDYLRQGLDSPAFTLQAYKKFITAQRTACHHIPETKMHQIVCEQFASLLGTEVPDFIRKLEDHSTLDAEVEKIKVQAAAKEVALKNRDKALAGEGRFDGEINTAWANYFTSQKAFLSALAPLCKFMAGKPALLEQEDADRLNALDNPSYEKGKFELLNMEQKYKLLATGNSSISTPDLLTSASQLQKTENLTKDLQTSAEKAETAFQIYSELDDERAAIAGRNINPFTDAVSSDSQLAHVYDVVSDASKRRSELITERGRKIEFLRAFASPVSLQALYSSLPVDPRRI